MRDCKLFINGEYCEAASGKTYQSIHTGTGEVVANVAQGGAEDVRRACEAAQAAYEGEWGRMDAPSRGAIIRKAADLIMERLPELAEMETLDVGKPITESSNIDIPVSASYLKWYGEVCLDNLGETIPVPTDSQVDFSLRQPYGVVAGIAPWNFPLFLGILKIGPALAMGNTVVIKPASITPMTTLAMGGIFAEAGLPPGALNVVAGPGAEVGEALCLDKRVQKVFFTGSTEVGRRVIHLCAENITDMSMELGGKSPNLIFADADWEQAVAGAVFGILLNNGQNCIAGSRLLVEESIYDDFVTCVADKFESLRVGLPMEADTQLGSIVSQQQFDTVMGYIEAGVAEGARVVAGGASPDPLPHPNGLYIRPTLLADVDNKMRVAQEEIFGPVLVAIPFKDEDDAIRIANDTPYGLGSGVFTRNGARAQRVLRALQSGTVYVNCYNAVYPTSPFPAWKQSGIGVERGLHGLLENCRYKNVIMDISEQPIGWFGG
ncbi:MAG: aldehyde dehydrogenase [Armatimonadetes bacterium]|nr:aldehyde dehydrogenase [Armatimonadota bacterium]